MRTETGIFIGAIVAGMALWVLDAALEHHHSPHVSFAAALLTEAPRHRTAMRVIVLVTLVVLGTIIADAVARRRSSDRELDRISRLSQLILGWAGEGIFGLDLQGRFTFANPAAGVMLGYEPHELVGQPALALIHRQQSGEAGQEGERSLLTAAYEDGDVYHVSEETFWRRNGESFLAEYTTTPLREDGQIVGAVVVFKDVTERKLAEENLRATLEELARSNRELEQFAYIASHDLQEPLRMVRGYLDLLARRYGEQLDGDAQVFLGHASAGAERMKRLIDDLLQYSRVSTRGREPQPTAVDQAVDEALQNLEAAVAESGAQITRDRLPTVMADHTQLVQLYQNLISNAIKFRGPQPPRIHLGAERDGQMWRLSVADNGIGIAPEQSERIFAIFQRLHGPDEYPGTGIGLAICRRIVERHGGRIWVESTEGHGATFLFTLPAPPGATTEGS